VLYDELLTGEPGLYRHGQWSAEWVKLVHPDAQPQHADPVSFRQRVRDAQAPARRRALTGYMSNKQGVTQF